MNDELKKQLSEYLGKLLSAVERGAQFAADQVPLIVQEKLQYELVYSLAWGIIGLLLLALAANRALHTVKAIASEKDDRVWSDQKCFSVWLGGLLPFVGSLVFGVILAPSHLSTALKIYLAPRLYIVEWLRGML